MRTKEFRKKPKKCKKYGCQTQAMCKGMCTNHYQSMQRKEKKRKQYGTSNKFPKYFLLSVFERALTPVPWYADKVLKALTEAQK